MSIHWGGRHPDELDVVLSHPVEKRPNGFKCHMPSLCSADATIGTRGFASIWIDAGSGFGDLGEWHKRQSRRMLKKPVQQGRSR
jgi:hypothetical protein